MISKPRVLTPPSKLIGKRSIRLLFFSMIAYIQFKNLNSETYKATCPRCYEIRSFIDSALFAKEGSVALYIIVRTQDNVSLLMSRCLKSSRRFL